MHHQTLVKLFIVVILMLSYCDIETHATSLGKNVTLLNSVFLKQLANSSLGELLHQENRLSTNLSSLCFGDKNDVQLIESCLVDQCLNAGVISELYNVSLNATLREDDLRDLAPAVLFSLHQRQSCQTLDDMTSTTPSPAAVWGYSFLFVTLINLCSLTGIMVLPCMKTAIYHIILMVMVALAVGTLVGSGVLVLIPEAFELVHVGGGGSEGDDSGHSYIWTSTSVIGGIYLFFVIERVMRIINYHRENTKDKQHRDELATQGTITSSFTRNAPPVANADMKNPAHLNLEKMDSVVGLCNMNVSQQQTSSGVNSQHSSTEEVAAYNSEHVEGKKKDGLETDTKGAPVSNTNTAENGHGHHVRIQDHSNGNGKVAPVAYMVIFGDGLHNFIDGLSIGAAFTDSILLGISVSVAVICEELPHELGDFAILLNAGMRLRRALMYNFLSSLMCYLGLVLGILVGENTTAHTWIFGVAGGMFLYIALVDMMPEMNGAAETEEGKKFGMVKTFLLQNVGLLTGYTLILLMVLYGDQINFE